MSEKVANPEAFFFQAEDGIRDCLLSRGLGDVYKRQDQSNIQQSLACLPVFLAGCQMLLVVAGPTYCSRLWCVMELFAFARSERLLHTYLNLAVVTRRSSL